MAGLEIFAAALPPEDLIRGDYVASRVGSYIKEGAQLNAKLVSEVLERRALELAHYQFSKDLVSQEALKGIFRGFEQIDSGLEGLRATFDWGFGQIIWQLELQTETLKDILKVLQAPLDTQAKELRRRAEYAYQNGWIDEAEQDFLESEQKNYQDFSVHFSLGMIYLYHKIDLEKALKYFQQTVKYALPASHRYTAQGWFYVGFILYLQHKYVEAIEAFKQVLKFNPEFHDAYYQIAKNWALLSKPDGAIENLRKAILADKNYCLKADIDKDFDGIRICVNNLFEQLKQEAKAKLPSESYITISSFKYKQLQEIVKDIRSRHSHYCERSILLRQLVSFIDWHPKAYSVEMFKKCDLVLSQYHKLQTLESDYKTLYKRDNYFDYLDCLSIARKMRQITQMVLDFLRQSKNYISRVTKEIEEVEKAIWRATIREKNKRRKEILEILERIFIDGALYTYGFIGFIIGLGVGARTDFGSGAAGVLGAIIGAIVGFLVCIVRFG